MELAQKNRQDVSLLELCRTFFILGATTFGGMWAATQKLESEIVHKKGWLTIEELQSLLVAATLIPAPKFIGFGALVGFHLRGWMGSVISLFSLLFPGAFIVLLAAILIHPSLLSGPLDPVRRAVGIAIIGLLIGNAYHQLRNPKVKGTKRYIGITIALAVAILSILGVPLVVAAVGGFVAGAFFIRKEKEIK